MALAATELSLKDLFAPRLEQVACLTEKRVVVDAKNNSRSRYLKSYYVSVKFTYSPTTRAFRRTIFFSRLKLPIQDSMLEEGPSFRSVSKPEMRGKCLEIHSSQKKRDPSW